GDACFAYFNKIWDILGRGSIGIAMPAHQGKFVAYFRVSTDKQGKSGLGLEAQREAVLTYLDGGRWSLLREFVEVESGKRNDRPELTASLAACKKGSSRSITRTPTSSPFISFRRGTSQVPTRSFC